MVSQSSTKFEHKVSQS